MNIHEYQAKQVFRRFGIPVLEGGVAETAEEAVALAERLPGEVVVVKAQIHAGGRGKGRFQEFPERGGVVVLKDKGEVGAVVRRRGLLAEVREVGVRLPVPAEVLEQAGGAEDGLGVRRACRPPRGARKALEELAEQVEAVTCRWCSASDHTAHPATNLRCAGSPLRIR